MCLHRAVPKTQPNLHQRPTPIPSTDFRNLIPNTKKDLFFPTLPEESNSHPRQPDNRSNDSISSLGARSFVRKIQPQPSVDESEGDDRAGGPHVDVRDDGSALVLAVRQVLQQAAESDEPDGGEDDEADDGVGGVELWVSLLVRGLGLKWFYPFKNGCFSGVWRCEDCLPDPWSRRSRFRFRLRRLRGAVLWLVCPRASTKFWVRLVRALRWLRGRGRGMLCRRGCRVCQYSCRLHLLLAFAWRSRYRAQRRG